MRTGFLSAALAALVLHPAVAEAKPKPAPVPASPVQLPYVSANLPSSPEVRAFYAASNYSIWFNGNAVNPAAAEMKMHNQRIANLPQLGAVGTARSKRRQAIELGMAVAAMKVANAPNAAGE